MSDMLKDTLQQYREVFMDYMEYTSGKEFSDDVLICMALNRDMQIMKENMIRYREVQNG